MVPKAKNYLKAAFFTAAGLVLGCAGAGMVFLEEARRAGTQLGPVSTWAERISDSLGGVNPVFLGVVLALTAFACAGIARGYCDRADRINPPKL